MTFTPFYNGNFEDAAFEAPAENSKRTGLVTRIELARGAVIRYRSHEAG